MAYAIPEDLYTRIKRSNLEGVIIDSDPDMMTQEEIDQAVTAAADQAIAGASGVIDSYCRGRYPVPFSPVPEMIKRVCVDIAVYDLYGRRDGGDEDTRNRYKNAVSFLKEVATGVALLDTGENSAQPESQPVRITSSPRIFSRESMKGF